MKFATPFLLALLPVAYSAAFAPGGRHGSVVTRGAPLQMGLLGRFRKKRALEIPKTISVGSTLPEVDVQVVEGGETIPMTIQEALGDGTSVLVGMPGAFTPTCSTEHLPGYVQCAPTLEKLGVNKIAVVTTNDKWVNSAWKKDLGIKDETSSPVTMISDGDGELVRELGLADDMGFGVGVRSKRFAIIVDDGKASHVEIDEGMDECESTSAANIVKVLSPESAGDVDVDPKSLAIIGGGAALLLAVLLMSSSGGGGGASGGGGGFSMLNDYI